MDEGNGLEVDMSNYLFRRLFAIEVPTDNGGEAEGYLNVICLAIDIDGDVSGDEREDALGLLSQMYAFGEYDAIELEERLQAALTHVDHMGVEQTIVTVCEQLPEQEQREVAFKMAAFLHQSDGQVSPIEGALAHLLARAFGFDDDTINRLFDELDAQVKKETPAAERDKVEAELGPQTEENNPFLDYRRMPRFGEVDAAQLGPAVATLLPELHDALDTLEHEAEATWAGVVEPLERLNDRLGFTWGLAHHLLSVKSSPELRAAFEAIQPKLVGFSVASGQSKPIYEKLVALRDGDEELDEAQRRIVEKLVRAAEHGGVGLEGEPRQRFNAIQMELAELGTTFSNNVLDATKEFERVITDEAELDGLPRTARQLLAHMAVGRGHEGATPEEGPWVATLDAPSLMPILRHAKVRALRHEIYMAYLTRASSGEHDNLPIIERILALRREESEILGFGDFAEASLSVKMAPDVDAVFSLLEELREVSYEAAEADHAELEAFAMENGFEGEELKQWDVAFWAERLKEARYDFEEEEVRPYFPFARVLQGLFDKVEGLFGVTIQQADGEAESWDEDVRFFKVFGEGGEQIAAFYLDPYARAGEKRPGAWHATCRNRSALLAAPGEDVRLPVSYMICNQTPPVGGEASLMTFGEVRTLFHEFGHGLQHMLTKVDYGMAAGISGIEWDAVELPSQFMENWCYQPETLKAMSEHVETGEEIPDAYIEKLRAARTFRSGSAMLRQLYFGMLDLRLHAEWTEGGEESVFDYQREVAARTSTLELLEEDRFLCSFAHIFAGGYAAGYYSYKWAEVLSADAFSAFEEAGLEDASVQAEVGRRFRDTVLAMGGGRHPLEVFKDFRGREPSTEALLRHTGLAG
jgi:oligopeptidase A